MTGTTRRALMAAAWLGLPLPPTLWNAASAAAQPGPQPSHAIEALRLLVPAAPGGGWDGTAQVIAQVLRETGAVGAVRFEYRPGAGGALALPRLFIGLRGRRDTLMVGGLTQVSSAIINQSALTVLDTTPIARLEGEPLVLAVAADSPLRTVADFARSLRADPLGVRVAGGSEGGADHILLALVGRTLGVDAFDLGYMPFSGGGPAGAAVLAGRAQAGISNWSEFAPHIEAGRMRALGLSGEARDPEVDVPTLREGGIDAVLYNWNAVFAAPGIDGPERAQLEAMIDAMVRSPAWEREAARRRWRLLYLPGREFEAFLRTETRSVEDTLVRLGLAQPREMD